jgi:hypothetical protein
VSQIYTMFLQRRMLSVSCHLPCDAVYYTVCFDVRAVSSCQVPGFRPGKIIPENILINYVGPQHVQDATNWSYLETYTSSSIVLGNELLILSGEASLTSMIISCWCQSAHGNQNVVLVICIFIISSVIGVMVKMIWWICQFLYDIAMSSCVLNKQHGKVICRQHYLLTFM